MIQRMLEIWFLLFLVPLPFLNPPYTPGSSQFTYCWSLAWRSLSIILLACEMSTIVQQFEDSLTLPLMGIGMKTDLFQPCVHCWVFQTCWHFKCNIFTASSFRIWNSWAGIPSPPLASFVVMLPKAHLTSHSRMYGFRWLTTPSWLSGSLRPFLYSSSVYSCHLFLTELHSVKSLLFLSFIVPVFAWNIPLIYLIFLKRSLVFPIVLFSSISLHCSLKKTFLSLLFFGTLHSNRYIFSFLLCLSLLFSSQLFVRPRQTTILSTYISFSCEWFWSLLQTSIHSSSGTLSDLIPWIYLSLPLNNHSESESCSVVSDSLRPHGLYRPWNSLSQNTGMGSCSLLQGIFPTQGSNPGLPHYRQILYQVSHKGSPTILEWVVYPFFSRSSWPRNPTGVSCIAGGFFTNWAKGKPE